MDKSIDGALLALRRNLVRDGGEGLAHVEALLKLRGVPMPRVLPKRQCVAGKGMMRLIVLEALRGGPQPLQSVVRHVEARRPELTHRQAYRRCELCLGRLRRAGLVVNEGGVWRLLWA